MSLTTKHLKVCYLVLWSVILFACERTHEPTFSPPQATDTAIVHLPTEEPTAVTAPGQCRPIEADLLGNDLRDSHILYQGLKEDLHYKQIWAVSLLDGSRKLLVEGYPVARSDLAFLQDGYHFLWADEYGDIWISDIDGTQPKKVESTSAYLGDFIPYSPKWNMLADPELFSARNDYEQGWYHSPDGKKIAIWEGNLNDSINSQLIIRDKATGQDVQVVKGQEESYYVEGNWSPNSNLFAFTKMFSPNGPRENRHGQVFVVEADGTDLRPVTQSFTPASLRRPIWSPDGQRFAFIIWEAEYLPNPSLGVVTLATGEVQMLLRGSSIGQSIMNQGEIIWSPDSQWIAFFTMLDRDINILNLDSGKIFCVTQDGYTIVEDTMDWR
jgi:hypothetical protein